MAPAGQTLSGSEYVLVAQVPRAGNRWHQVHFNHRVATDFFRLAPGDEHVAALERVDANGRLQRPVERKLVMSDVNGNAKIELDFGGVREYPRNGVPVLVLLELELRRFRYATRLPGEPGFDLLEGFNAALPSLGRGLRRGRTTLDELELRWPGCPLRSPLPPTT